MKKRSKKKMFILMGTFLIFAGVMIIFFNAPYSKTKMEFYQASRSLAVISNHEKNSFKQEDIIGLPMPVQKYFEYCGYIGMPKMQTMKVVYKDVKFKFGKGKPILIIDYVQYNIVDKPARIAYIDSSMYGIPFEGLDSYTAGKGLFFARAFSIKLQVIFPYYCISISHNVANPVLSLYSIKSKEYAGIKYLNLSTNINGGENSPPLAS